MQNSNSPSTDFIHQPGVVLAKRRIRLLTEYNMKTLQNEHRPTVLQICEIQLRHKPGVSVLVSYLLLHFSIC